MIDNWAQEEALRLIDEMAIDPSSHTLAMRKEMIIKIALALRAARDRGLEEENRLAGALELLCYSVAGTEGTATHSSMPVWYQARLTEAKRVLHEYHALKGEKA